MSVRVVEAIAQATKRKRCPMPTNNNHMKGVIFDSEERYCTLSESILAKKKFSCDYQDPHWDDMLHVEATSRDGIIYHEHWGQPR